MKLLIFLAFVIAFVIFKIVKAARVGVSAAHREVFGQSAAAHPPAIPESAAKLVRACSILGVEMPNTQGENKMELMVAKLSAAIVEAAASAIGKEVSTLSLEEASCLNVVTITVVDALSQRSMSAFEVSGTLATTSLWMGKFEGDEVAAILNNSTRGFNDIGRDAKWGPLIRRMGRTVNAFFDTGNRSHLHELELPAQALISVAHE